MIQNLCCTTSHLSFSRFIISESLFFVFLNIRLRPRALPRFVLASQPISLTASNRWKKFRVKVYWVEPSPPTLSITTRKTGWIRSETFIRFEDQNSKKKTKKKNNVSDDKVLLQSYFSNGIFSDFNFYLFSMTLIYYSILSWRFKDFSHQNTYVFIIF